MIPISLMGRQFRLFGVHTPDTDQFPLMWSFVNHGILFNKSVLYGILYFKFTRTLFEFIRWLLILHIDLCKFLPSSKHPKINVSFY